MNKTASQLLDLINEYRPGLKGLSEPTSSYKASPGKWSKKELVGHMIDSAQNNIRRFIVAQYEEIPHIIYRQDDWVAINNYQSQPVADLIELWYLLNRQMVSILAGMSDRGFSRRCQTESLQTIEWLAEDYMRHMKHHLHQVLDLAPFVYP